MVRVGFAPFLFLLLVVVPADAFALDVRELEARVRGGDVAGAIDAAQAAFKEDPTDLALARALQDLLQGQGRGPEARAVAEAAASDLAPYLQARMGRPSAVIEALEALEAEARFARFVDLDLARVLREMGETRDAERAVRDHLKAHPESAEGWTLQARLELDKGSTFAARKSIESALELDANRPEAVALLVEALWDPEDPAEARRALDAALKAYPQSSVLRLAQVDLHLRARDVEGALPVIEALAAAHPRDAEVLARWARVLRSVGRLEDAEKAARTLLELDPENPRGHLTLGFILEKKGDLDGALDRYLEAVGLAPGKTEGYVSAAFVQVIQKDYENAEKSLDRAFKIDGDDPGAHRVAGLLAFFQGDNREAKTHLRKVLKAWPDDVAALRAMGYIQLDDGRIKDAIDTFEHLLEIEPRDAPSQRMIGRALLENGKVEDAIAALDKALSFDEKDPWIHFDLGTAQEAGGNYDAAKEAYEKAIELDKDFPWPYLNLAEILDEIEGDPVAALDYYQRYLDLGGFDPDHQIAQRVSAIKNQ